MTPLQLDTIKKIAATGTGTGIENPAMWTAQILAGAVNGLANSASLHAKAKVRALSVPGENPATWTAILADALTEAHPPESSGIAHDETIRRLKPLFWFNGTSHRCANFNTGTVDKWCDLSGNAVDATASSNYPSVSATRCNGRMAITFADGLSMAATFPTMANLFIVAKVANNADNNFGLTNNTDTYIQLTGAGTGRPVALWWVAGGQTIHGYRKTFAAGEYRLYTLRVQRVPSIRGTGTPWLYSAGVDNYEHMVVGSGDAITGLTHIGAYPGSTYDLNADVACIVGCGAMSQTERDDMIGALMAEYNLEPPRYSRFLGLGDSLMQSVSPVTATQTYPYYLCGGETTPGLLSTDWTGFNAGIGGWTTRDVLGGSIGVLQGFSRHTNNVAVLSIGTNNKDITTPAETAADVAQICRLIRQHHGRTLLTPMFPRGAGYESFRAEYNALLADLVTNGQADAMVDPASEPLLWAEGANSNATYFKSSESPPTHLTAAGNLLWAQTTYQQIESLAALSYGTL